jgi:hypothetical protein
MLNELTSKVFCVYFAKEHSRIVILSADCIKKKIDFIWGIQP